MPGQVDGGSEGSTFKGLMDAEVLEAIFGTADGLSTRCKICGAHNIEDPKAHLEVVHHLVTFGTLEALKELITFERSRQSFWMSGGFVVAATIASWVIVNVVAHGKVSIVLGG